MARWYVMTQRGDEPPVGVGIPTRTEAQGVFAARVEIEEAEALKHGKHVVVRLEQYGKVMPVQTRHINTPDEKAACDAEAAAWLKRYAQKRFADRFAHVVERLRESADRIEREGLRYGVQLAADLEPSAVSLVAAVVREQAWGAANANVDDLLTAAMEVK